MRGFAVQIYFKDTHIAEMLPVRRSQVGYPLHCHDEHSLPSDDRRIANVIVQNSLPIGREHRDFRMGTETMTAEMRVRGGWRCVVTGNTVVLNRSDEPLRLVQSTALFTSGTRASFVQARLPGLHCHPRSMLSLGPRPERIARVGARRVRLESAQG